jgi:AraC family transcriptional regulator, transcriptional activator of pobA
MPKYELQTISDHNHGDKPFHVIQLLPLKTAIKREYHRHDYHEIMFFEKGGGEHIIDFRSQKINDYSAHFVLPGQVHKLNRSDDSTGYALLFSEDLILKGENNKSSILFDLPFYNEKFSSHLIVGKEDYQEIAFHLEKLVKEEKNELPLSNSITSAYTTLILYLLNRMCYRSEPKSSSETNTKTTLLIKFKRLTEQNFSLGHKPGDYASMLNVSTGYLNDIIREAYGKTTGEVIQDRIILESKRLLFYTDLSVNEVAHKLGFNDPAYYTRLFKKHLDTTPKEYRINIRKKSL